MRRPARATFGKTELFFESFQFNRSNVANTLLWSWWSWQSFIEVVLFPFTNEENLGSKQSGDNDINALLVSCSEIAAGSLWNLSHLQIATITTRKNAVKPMFLQNTVERYSFVVPLMAKIWTARLQSACPKGKCRWKEFLLGWVRGHVCTRVSMMAYARNVREEISLRQRCAFQREKWNSATYSKHTYTYVLNTARWK